MPSNAETGPSSSNNNTGAGQSELEWAQGQAGARNMAQSQWADEQLGQLEQLRLKREQSEREQAQEAALNRLKQTQQDQVNEVLERSARWREQDNVQDRLAELEERRMQLDLERQELTPEQEERWVQEHTPDRDLEQDALAELTQLRLAEERWVQEQAWEEAETLWDEEQARARLANEPSTEEGTLPQSPPTYDESQRQHDQQPGNQYSGHW